MAQDIPKNETTAVRWFLENYQQVSKMDFDLLIMHAIMMERKQIIKAHNNGKNILPPNENGEQYYDETYGSINGLKIKIANDAK